MIQIKTKYKKLILLQKKSLSLLTQKGSYDIFQEVVRANSSVGRAPALQAGCRGFKSLFAHEKDLLLEGPFFYIIRDLFLCEIIDIPYLLGYIYRKGSQKYE